MVDPGEQDCGIGGMGQETAIFECSPLVLFDMYMCAWAKKGILH